MTITPAARATAGLGFTQIVGWGTTFLMPSVLGRRMEDALGIPSEVVFSGITVMFAVGAICAPRIGRLIDRTGARTLMAVGSVVYALSLAALACSQGLVSYLLCWAGLGVASTLALSTPSSIAVAQVAGPGARRAIGMLAIIGGFASTVFWPLSGALDVAVGWRGTLLVYAAIHLFACAPIHLLVLPRRPPTHHLSATSVPAPTGVPPEVRSRAFLLLSLTLSTGAFVFTGAMVHMIEIFRGLGHPAASAVLLASLIGPAQVTIRLFELLFGHRYSIMNSAVVGSAMLPFALGLALLAGGNFAVAVVCIAAYGTSNGLKAVQRATLPLALFGRGQFGAYMGRLALPQGIVSAAAPPVVAAVLSYFGATGALWLTFVAGTASLVAMILLARLARTVASLTLRQKVDLDHGAAGQTSDADAGPRRPPVGREIAGIDFVHARVVGLEIGDVDARADHVLEAELEAGQHDLEILHHPHRLALDVGRQGLAVVVGPGRHLAGDEAPAVDLDGMAERRDRSWRAGDHEKKRCAHGSLHSIVEAGTIDIRRIAANRRRRHDLQGPQETGARDGGRARRHAGFRRGCGGLSRQASSGVAAGLNATASSPAPNWHG